MLSMFVRKDQKGSVPILDTDFVFASDTEGLFLQKDPLLRRSSPFQGRFDARRKSVSTLRAVGRRLAQSPTRLG